MGQQAQADVDRLPRIRAVSRADAAQIRSLRERVEELQETIRQLAEPPEQAGSICLDYGLTAQETRVMATLLRFPGRVVSKGQLLLAMCYDRPEQDWPEPKIIDVHISHIRKKLGDKGHAIETHWGRGFRVKPGVFDREAAA